MNALKLVLMAAIASSVSGSVFASTSDMSSMLVYEQVRIVAADCNLGRVRFVVSGESEIALIDQKQCETALKLLYANSGKDDVSATLIVSVEKVSYRSGFPTVVDIGEYKVNGFEITP